ncbi:hypothetical protein F3Y22_tig00111166pilonHSYRG00344 [Hibiscus syriacus]|uniref:Uncharacterized protein n=1 Tax=Hibiscus syriacus TaxID=106335 RepID=A0A6A2YX59_HIBSY|nr:hypothetical protein F3Y22_tig00111166pilonHSYRG00344 [Hibiscus syriacus]
MEEMMMMMSSSSSPNNQSNEASTCTTWKVYDNPFYCPHHQQLWLSSKHPHHQNNFPFCDLTSVMDSELDIARAQIIDLQAELVKRQSQSTRNWLKSLPNKEWDIEEERNMLRMAEVIREERVQIKMAEAKILFEEKLLALEETKRAPPPPADKEDKPPSSSRNTGVTMSSSMAIQRKASRETENPHIKRGIKGFVEFPRGVQTINGSRSRNWGSKLECQKAQLRILLKRKSPIPSNCNIMS